MYYQVQIKISRQEDGLWRLEALDFQGCIIDTPTLAEGLCQIHEAIAMSLDLDREEGRPLPKGVQKTRALPLYASIPVFPDEVEFYNILPDGDRVPASPAAVEKLARGEKPFSRGKEHR